ncbi:hypothetical protein DEU56DRAFT_905539 [Suillus clintonianus]|uniref:uncharacterized protein n=1 Tax=Suillus clintonianus TaxID=1904413 RepID=UPI001B87F17B|nr:uncharacterized protein DEU56DRAFT_905539 [Suillus clintonianus]KAG2111352.1 hypothetical protein DEU56DRAFT_905539 [Suillus clintonianus]
MAGWVSPATGYIPVGNPNPGANSEDPGLDACLSEPSPRDLFPNGTLSMGDSTREEDELEDSSIEGGRTDALGGTLTHPSTPILSEARAGTLTHPSTPIISEARAGTSPTLSTNAYPTTPTSIDAQATNTPSASVKKSGTADVPSSPILY